MAKRVEVSIKAADRAIHTIPVVGLTPLVMHRFAEKARNEIREKHALGDAGKAKKVKEPKNFEQIFEDVQHRSTDGWTGIPALAFKGSMINACRTAGYQMTKARLAFDVVQDGFDCDAYPLVKITKGKPKKCEHMVRIGINQNDLRVRAMWAPGWEANVTISFDQGMFTLDDVYNLLDRAGRQVGILEGRPGGKTGAGMGWGLFEVKRGKK